MCKSPVDFLMLCMTGVLPGHPLLYFLNILLYCGYFRIDAFKKDEHPKNQYRGPKFYEFQQFHTFTSSQDCTLDHYMKTIVYH